MAVTPVSQSQTTSPWLSRDATAMVIAVVSMGLTVVIAVDNKIDGVRRELSQEIRQEIRGVNSRIDGFTSCVRLAWGHPNQSP